MELNLVHCPKLSWTPCIIVKGEPFQVSATLQTICTPNKLRVLSRKRHTGCQNKFESGIEGSNPTERRKPFILLNTRVTGVSIANLHIFQQGFSLVYSTNVYKCSMMLNNASQCLSMLNNAEKSALFESKRFCEHW